MQKVAQLFNTHININIKSEDAFFLNYSSFHPLITIFDAFLCEQPPSQALCILQALLHTFAIQHNHDKAPPFGLKAAGQTRACCVCDSSFDANIKIRFLLH